MSLNLNYKPEAVVEISGLSREEWLDYRKKGIGGSDAAAIMGVSPFATKRDLFYDKTGIRPAFQENEDNWVAKEVGHRLEDLVAEIFSQKTGLKIFPVRTMFRHPLYPFMLADVDFFIEFADGTYGILECKTTNYNCQEKWANNTIPVNYEYQVRHYMSVMNIDKLYHFETQAAKDLATLLVQTYMPPAGLEDLITQAQKDLKLLLSDKQVEAVKKAFTNLVSIITGGPGTGKTTVQRVLLYISEKLGEEKILLTAPTGRASRRMAESTGKSDALTLHSALGLNNDEECEAADEMLSEDFIIADEFTMADMRLSYELFKHIEKGVRVVIVGDVDQLPSVGPGNVFRELVLCGVIPVTILDMVFRQGKDSRIAANAHKMQENDTNLDYGDDFIFCPADTAAEAADKVAEYYRSFVDAYGVDNVQVLTPFRKKGEASVNALNDRLWEMVNPKSSIARELKAGNALYREGDRIIHNKNKNDISNGDIGYITDIYQDEDGVDLMRLSFSDGRIVEYSAEDADLIEHAYATTVHKSQGSEYKVVILPWLPMFYMMLRRNILYTAITRAKEKIVIVGSKKALYQAIHNTACDKRNTRLGERIVREYNELLTKKASA